MSNDKDTLREEYPEELIKSGIRGKYAKSYREGTHIVLIDPDLHKLFPDSEAVNLALREYVSYNENGNLTHAFTTENPETVRRTVSDHGNGNCALPRGELAVQAGVAAVA